MSFLRKLVGGFGLTAMGQTMVTLVGAVSGFVVIHAMDKDHYAEYSYLQSWIAFWTMLAGMGNLGAFLALARQNAGSADSVSRITAVIWRLNRPFFVVGLIAALGFWIYASWARGWWGTDYLITSALALALGLTAVRQRFHQSVLQFQGLFGVIARVFPVAEIGRCLGFVGCAALGLGGFSAPFLAVTLLCAVSLNLYLSRSESGAWTKEKVAEEDLARTRPKFWQILRPLLFPSYYSQFQGFLTTILVVLFASTNAIADVGALGRLMMLMIIFDKTLEIAFFPRLAREPTFASFDRKLRLGVGLIAVGFALVVVSSVVFPGLWLVLLGRQYTNLGPVLVWAVLAACVERISGTFMWGMLARGVAKHQTWITLAGLAGQIAFLAHSLPNTVLLATLFNLTRVAVSCVAQITSYGLIRSRLLRAEALAG